MSSQEILLSDYKLSDYTITNVNLTFKLNPNATVVKSQISLKFLGNANPTLKPPLILHGQEMKLLTLTINGKVLDKHEYKLCPTYLEVPYKSFQSDSFKLECVTEINPRGNTSLEGLYLSNEI